MICCGMDLGKGKPYVLVQYWCNKCQTEHLADAKDMTDYIAELARGSGNAGQQGLPDIL